MEYNLDDNLTLELNQLLYWGQVAVKIGDYWIGDLTHKEHIQKRLDRTIPTDMSNMTVLDIGASDGLFSYESICRGAKNVVAVESDKHSYKNIGAIVDFFKYPIKLISQPTEEVTKEQLLALNNGSKYSLGLMLNV